MSDSLQAGARVTQAPMGMSYEAYLDWDHEGGLAEWVNGEIIITMPPKDEHQNIVEFLHHLMGLFVQIMGLGKVRIAPFAMRACIDGPVREPDLIFLATAHLDRLTAKELLGPADLVVEVISDDSVARDRADKFYEYQEASITEYWIIDPRPGKERVDFYVLDEQKRYQPVPITADNRYHSTVLPGFWLKIAWLWSAEPGPLVALAEIVGTERIMAALMQK